MQIHKYLHNSNLIQLPWKFHILVKWDNKETLIRKNIKRYQATYLKAVTSKLRLGWWLQFGRFSEGRHACVYVWVCVRACQCACVCVWSLCVHVQWRTACVCIGVHVWVWCMSVYMCMWPVCGHVCCGTPLCRYACLCVYVYVHVSLPLVG